MIQGALARSEGNQCAAARMLGIHRNTLQRKMVEYNLVQNTGRARRKPASRAGQIRKKRAAIA
jgi:DNA-binding NtrC family response regulator